MRVLFLHGLGVKTAGIKPTYLREKGCDIVEPALPHADFEQACSLAQRALDEHERDVIVGDCRGGSVALALDSASVPLVLIAPAWKKWGRVQVTKPNTIILHCRQDRVIPFEHSRELVRRSALPLSALWTVGRDHFMDDQAALDALHGAVQHATSRSWGPQPLVPKPCTASEAEHVAGTSSAASRNASALPSLRDGDVGRHDEADLHGGHAPRQSRDSLAQQTVLYLPGAEPLQSPAKDSLREAARDPSRNSESRRELPT